MPLTKDGPVGPGTFARDGYSVTIAQDGKVQVKKDDWLSKYAWALYGDYEKYEGFVRGNPEIKFPTEEIKGIKEIEDENLIKTGEYLIHVPTYFYWKEKNGAKPVPLPPKKKPVSPGNVRSMNWMAANLGALDGIYYVGTAGAVALAFRNMDIGTTFYYVLLRGGVGLGWSAGDTVKDMRKLLRTIYRAVSAAVFAKKAATANFVPVMANFPLSAQSLEGYDYRCLSGNATSGTPGVNYSYEKITGYTSRFDYMSVAFVDTSWTLPGIGAGYTRGKLIWVW